MDKLKKIKSFEIWSRNKITGEEVEETNGIGAFTAENSEQALAIFTDYVRDWSGDELDSNKAYYTKEVPVIFTLCADGETIAEGTADVIEEEIINQIDVCKMFDDKDENYYGIYDSNLNIIAHVTIISGDDDYDIEFDGEIA